MTTTLAPHVNLQDGKKKPTIVTSVYLNKQKRTYIEKYNLKTLYLSDNLFNTKLVLIEETAIFFHEHFAFLK